MFAEVRLSQPEDITIETPNDGTNETTTDINQEPLPVFLNVSETVSLGNSS